MAIGTLWGDADSLWSDVVPGYQLQPLTLQIPSVTTEESVGRVWLHLPYPNADVWGSGDALWAQIVPGMDVTLAIPTTAFGDTRRQVSASIGMRGDTKRRVWDREGGQGDTVRRLWDRQGGQGDTLRQVLASDLHLGDTLRIVTATETGTGDTRRVVSESEGVPGDTLRQVFASVGVGGDTLRQIFASLSEGGFGDTLRIVGPVEVGVPGDTRREVQATVSTDVDTRRDIVNPRQGDDSGGGDNESPHGKLLGWIWLRTKTWPLPNFLDLRVPPKYVTFDYAAPIDWYWYLVPTVYYYGQDVSDWKREKPQEATDLWQTTHLLSLPEEVIRVAEVIAVSVGGDTKRIVSEPTTGQGDTERIVGMLAVSAGGDTLRIVGAVAVGVGGDTFRAVGPLPQHVGGDTKRIVTASTTARGDTSRTLLPGDVGFRTYAVTTDSATVTLSTPYKAY